MSIKTRAAAVVLAAVAFSWTMTAGQADTLTQTATLPPTTTNFNTNGSGVAPLTFQQFDTQGGKYELVSVQLSVSASIQNGFGMTFTTPATITGTVSSSQTSSTTGPSVSVYTPDGTTALITAGSSTPATRSETYGNAAGQTTFPVTFSSSNASTSPFYIAPVTTTASNTNVLSAANDPNWANDQKLFTGTGSISLPVSAQAYSHFVSTSGNGVYSVTTQGSADATVTYTYQPTQPQLPPTNPVPEPTTVLLWGVAGVAALGFRRIRRSR